MSSFTLHHVESDESMRLYEPEVYAVKESVGNAEEEGKEHEPAGSCDGCGGGRPLDGSLYCLECEAEHVEDEAWARAGVDDRSRDVWRDAGFEEWADAERWVRAGVEAEDAAYVRDEGGLGPYDEAIAWLQVPCEDLDDLRTWRAWRVSPAVVKAMVDGKDDLRPPRLSYHAAGFPIEEATLWSPCFGEGDDEIAIWLWGQGVTLDDAVELDYSPGFDTCRGYRRAGLPVTVASLMNGASSQPDG